jgi:hypothetical protein
MKINWRRVLKREAFFLKTGKMSRRRDLVQPDRQYRRRQEPKKKERHQQAETEVKVEPMASGQTGLNLLVETPLSARLGALRN